MSFLRFVRYPANWTTLLLAWLGADCAAFVASFAVLREYFPIQIIPRFITFVVASCLVSALLGPVLWWWAIIKPDRLSVRRGIGVGALGGILAHPLVLYVVFVEAYLTRENTASSV